MKQKCAFIFCLSFFFLFTSCTSHRPIEVNNLNIQYHIQPGDKVRVLTKDNKETEFKVTEVTDDAIVGESENIKFSDIAQLEKENISNGTKILLFTVGIAVVLGLAFISASTGSSYDDTWW